MGKSGPRLTVEVTSPESDNAFIKAGLRIGKFCQKTNLQPLHVATDILLIDERMISLSDVYLNDN
ncbi:hypothetical protein BFW38_08030 [Terasakiispira papahanaumokuakeensis]|uniref:Uncharacterized protein n=1 Tax=Terasakiispira papahanaumokuakeensis TaxID=197479 RepID=A0A1E2V9A4_9GAMM|nr:hypothetical protein BFW38_08030 [Terasakiispira papahanaumokuakeensis]